MNSSNKGKKNKVEVRLKVSVPTAASVVAALVAGVLAVLNQTVFNFGSEWYNYINIALVFLAGLGITPLTGKAFRAALHLPPWVLTVITAALAALQVALTSVGMPNSWHAVIVAAITVLAGLGFAAEQPANLDQLVAEATTAKK